MVKDKKEISEEKTAAASYILNFYQLVQNLNHNYSAYLNRVIELEHAQKAGKAQHEDMHSILELSQNIRYYCTQGYIHYCTIMEGLNKEQDKKVQEKYEAILKQLIINREDIRDYVVALNLVLMKDIIKRLLESSQDILSNIMSTNQPENEKG